MRKAIIIATCLLLVGCNEPRPAPKSQIEVGETLSAQSITRVNDCEIVVLIPWRKAIKATITDCFVPRPIQ